MALDYDFFMYGVANMYDGGWRKEDKKMMMEEYELTEEEADQICAELEEIEKEMCK